MTIHDVQAAILSAYAGQIDNEFVVQAAALFTQEVEEAINFAMRLSHYWLDRTAFAFASGGCGS